MRLEIYFVNLEERNCDQFDSYMDWIKMKLESEFVQI